MNRLKAIGAAGSASLIAIALVLTPALAQRGGEARSAPSMRSAGTFTPAVSDPRLAAVLARSGSRSTLDGEFRFTPATASNDRKRSVRVAIRARATTPAEAVRDVAQASSASAVTSVTPVSYTLGASVGWRRFAISGDVARSEGGILPGGRDSAKVGMSYRADKRITGRVQLSAERSEGVQRIVADDEAYALDVGGSYSIARNIDVTGGVRYRIARDRLDPIARDERLDSQAVYIGTAFKF